MRGLLAVLLAALLAPGTLFAGPAPRDAAQLALLLERTGNLHLQATEGVAGAKARRALAQALQRTDRVLAAASRDAPPALREHYALFSLWWRQQRSWLARPPARDAAASQRDRDEEGAWLGERGRRLAGEPPGPADDAWHAARLSQRVMRIALLRRGFAEDSLLRLQVESLAELRERLERLQSATGPDSPAGAEVQVARSQLEFLARALEEPALRGRSADVAARSADHVLEALERALRRIEAPVSASD